MLWGELAEKVFLLSLMSVIFAEILPVRGGERRRGRAAVAVIVVVNTAVSHVLARATSPRGSVRRPARGEPAFIYLLSTFFSPAENFPLGTALFFAFLITLLLWLYDVYKPVYDVRFAQAARSIETGTSGSNNAQSTVA